MAELVPSTTSQPPHVAKSLRSAFDLSLYLVTGRDLLPHGKVPFFFAICCLSQINFLGLLNFSRARPFSIPPIGSSPIVHAGNSRGGHNRTSPRKKRRHRRGALSKRINLLRYPPLRVPIVP